MENNLVVYVLTSREGSTSVFKNINVLSKSLSPRLNIPNYKEISDYLNTQFCDDECVVTINEIDLKDCGSSYTYRIEKHKVLS